MLKTERFHAIMSLLERSGTVKVSEIMEKLSVSDMTVRRDLDELEKQGLLERVHGGARLKNLYRQVELSHDEKQIMYKEEKQRIVEKANELIHDGDTIFLGPGTTLEMLAKVISGNSLRIVTNCLPIFQELQKNHQDNHKIYLLGGEFRETTQCFIGEITNKSLEDMNFHKAFLSCNALSEQKIMTSTFEEGQTQKLALDNSVERYLLIDHSKVGKKDFSVFYHLQDITAVIIDDDEQKHYEKVETEEKYIV
ncbi:MULTISPECIES: DeoR/GlpR family DNA-binding transcription regulator [unclassified Staphylococcus]|uniref:DeoR/GlpR family DNA-binding transcription regulator n=1 Tax=unclassified Staphylococcus TaxID=91994 RepID=UPI0021CEBAA1|nr:MULTISPECIES: DeoR/GlpR family DNA-binding transcription regulator [unclassified Staphylococcus]UXR70222.1 DeoR/GlpR family DNA-binding transcription regulator [Staphylococcus sp. IVB6246]UXR72284.1 DeoR/GlpR family DNA-binding transcription regulator [Staphylococcus sp. IVB6240]UXR74592.1 DeoR/GlpR family DNA-binding transcription regulator [Staphylococcus sp. IVB6238]UXR76977.1 DeoR/GlpR family DNA-binding transcription regulator [Staphylococcus sp. IVB6233]UXR81103.1 DeoR/GlpR family DNA